MSENKYGKDIHDASFQKVKIVGNDLTAVNEVKIRVNWLWEDEEFYEEYRTATLFEKESF